MVALRPVRAVVCRRFDTNWTFHSFSRKASVIPSQLLRRATSTPPDAFRGQAAIRHHPKTTVARYDPAACGLPTGRRSFEPRTRLSYRIDPQPRCEEVQNDLACDRIPAHAALLLRSKSLLPSRDVLPEDHMLWSCRKDKQRVEREAEVVSPDSCGYPPFRLALKGHPGTLVARAKRCARQLTRADAAPGPEARVHPRNMPRSKPIAIDLPC